MKFVAMPKIPRLEREIIITEKIDGTNANILIFNPSSKEDVLPSDWMSEDTNTVIRPGSRTRWLTPTKDGDNFGFAKWVHDNAKELIKLGPGHHFGEWWGRGIQRTYDLDHRRFSLFNVSRWTKEVLAELGLDKINVDVVPHLDTASGFNGVTGPFIDDSFENLRRNGSFAAPGFMKPEGIILYHVAANQLFKKTFEGDAAGKGQ